MLPKIVVSKADPSDKLEYETWFPPTAVSISKFDGTHYILPASAWFLNVPTLI